MYSVLLLLFSLLVTAYVFLQHIFQYWQSLGVPQLQPHWLLGNYKHLKSVHLTELLQAAYAEFKGKALVAGVYVYTRPALIVLDLDVVKAILIKDFNKFTDRVEYKNTEADPLSTHLFSVHGEWWRPLRSKLSPTFTTGKMKLMFPMVSQVSRELVVAVERQLDQSADGTLELHDLMARYTTDVIASCAFGIECDSLSNPNVEFRRMGRGIFYSQNKNVRWRIFKSTYAHFLSHFGMKRFSSKHQQFFTRLVCETVAMREERGIERQDFLQLLMALRHKDDDSDLPPLTAEQLAAQVFVFFAAGFETSSSNMSYALFELAKHQDVQLKARDEIQEILRRHGDVLSYEAMLEMRYLDQIITETLRLYPALASLTRIAQENYRVPGSNITITQGTKVLIPAKAIHYDADIYEQPAEFRPERFEYDAQKTRHPQAFLGFGDGPRNCIGLRFARMQVRIGLVALLQHFRFTLCDKMPHSVEIYNNSFVLVPARGVWLRAERLQKVD